ncbi:MAG TPA: hypothetical protein VK442_06915 [Xanthobacteraceae bacterium]|nr:hypothetical protein [Xanthobacteraceae bacterium]
MMAKVWRERLTYAAMSLFVAWHTLAMVVAPATGTTDVMRGLRVVLQPYLDLFELDNDWDFFAPEVGKDSILRYVIKDAAGVEHSFDTDANLNWFQPSSIWFRAWYLAVVNSPDDFAEEFAALFCREHAELHPVAIAFFEVEEKDYGPLDRLRGKRPKDAEFVTVTEVKSFECPR